MQSGLKTSIGKGIYDIHKSYEENLKEGPFFSGDIPQVNQRSRSSWIELFGLPVASPIGIPAGPLLGSNWIAFASRMGFDILTYKTIRSYPSPAHPVPNVLFVNHEQSFKREDIGTTVIAADHDPKSLAITNSFGNPSMDPEFLSKDIVCAREVLKEGQILIVSVFGTGTSLEEVSNSFVSAAKLAVEAGAHVIEVNYSCPNIKNGSPLFLDIESMESINRAIHRAISPIPHIAKMGFYADRNHLLKALHALARSGSEGICGINTIPMQVKKADGTFALGSDRKTSGICGAPIRDLALEFVRDCRMMIQKMTLPLQILGCGGITHSNEFDLFLDAGADAALTATGMMWNPYLAHEWKGEKNEQKKTGECSV